MGVMLMGCSSCDWSSSLTLAISWRGKIAVRIGQKPVSGKVGRIGVDRFPAFHQGQLLEAQITVDPARLALRAARSASSNSRDR